jgi:hypothetical protein
MGAYGVRVAAFLAAQLLLSSNVVSAQRLPEPWADPEDQPGRVDVSASIGVLMPTEWSNLVLLGSISSASGILEQVVSRELRVESHQGYGAAFTYWRGRYGFRVQGDYSKSSLRISNAQLGAPPVPASSSSVPIQTYLYDVRGAVGFVEYERGRNVWPYGFLGFGGITYDLGDTTITPPLTVLRQPGATINGDPTIIVRDDGRQFVLSADELGVKTVFGVSFGAGADFRIPVGPGGVGLRVEISDRLANSPVNVTIRELARSGPFSTGERVRFGLVHHVTASLGFVVHIGR